MPELRIGGISESEAADDCKEGSANVSRKTGGAGEPRK